MTDSTEPKGPAAVWLSLVGVALAAGCVAAVLLVGSVELLPLRVGLLAVILVAAAAAAGCVGAACRLIQADRQG